MRRKLTEADKNADFSDLPELTEQQRLFVSGVLSGQSSSAAYRAAYNCENSKDTTIWVEASRLRNHPNVALWISEARKAGLGSPKVSLDNHITRLERLSELCIVSGNMGAAVQAEQLIGKASGHYVDQVRDVTADPMQALREIATLSPELAKRLAIENGIDWQDNGTEH